MFIIAPDETGGAPITPNPIVIVSAFVDLVFADPSDAARSTVRVASGDEFYIVMAADEIRARISEAATDELVRPFTPTLASRSFLQCDAYGITDSETLDPILIAANAITAFAASRSNGNETDVHTRSGASYTCDILWTEVRTRVAEERSILVTQSA